MGLVNLVSSKKMMHQYFVKDWETKISILAIKVLVLASKIVVLSSKVVVIALIILLYLPKQIKKMKMKKISIVLLALFFIGIANVNAQSDATTEIVVAVEDVNSEEGVKTCTKTGKVCNTTCENKKNGTCCKGEKKKSCSKSEKASCSKNKEGSFDFDKSNSYVDKKSSCSKADKKKGCCKKEATAATIK